MLGDFNISSQYAISFLRTFTEYPDKAFYLKRQSVFIFPQSQSLISSY